jgi:predicted regulator of Ras-like GTPase activity (Roadblock/LC7/MglB family)
MGKKEEALEVLNDLLRLDDVLACMLARKDLGGVAPEKMKIKDVSFWNVVKESTNKVFPMIEKFRLYGVERVNLELGEYVIIFAPLNQTYSLMVIIPALSNLGLIDVEIENTKRKISSILDKKEEINTSS